jgi:tetratricopeptide (TPR) repeat protein
MFDAAIQDYESAIKIDPNHFKAYYNRAFCWDKLGDYEKSEADYE